MIINNLRPSFNELPSEYADRIGKRYIAGQSLEHKKNYAQFFTPLSIAKFMAERIQTNKLDIKIADLGAGTGVLGISICETIIEKHLPVKTIELTVYEIDEEIIDFLRRSLEFTKTWLKTHNVLFIYTIKNKDFILENADVLRKDNQLFLKVDKTEKYDFIISNPPYFKLNKSDSRAKVAESIVHGQPNIYALFMAISAHLLNSRGELIYITPRSYTAGPYFRLFREHFFSLVNPTFIHIFGSRDKAFNKDDVLQENIILQAKKKEKRKNNAQVVISFSKHLEDLKNSQLRKVPIDKIINMESKNKVVSIPLTREEDKIIKLVHSWKGNLYHYGLKISTGPVVPFRAKDFIGNSHNGDDHMPLLWMQNIRPMTTTWPARTHKHQFIHYTNDSKNLLVKNSNYVLVRRFSAKEDEQRLVAAPYLASAVKANLIGLENHLNYIYRPEGEVSIEEAYGLAALYNCKLLDVYFRTFNGNTQVSATELNDMPLPELDIIKKIGSNILKYTLQREELDTMVTSVLINRN